MSSILGSLYTRKFRYLTQRDPWYNSKNTQEKAKKWYVGPSNIPTPWLTPNLRFSPQQSRQQTAKTWSKQLGTFLKLSVKWHERVFLESSWFQESNFFSVIRLFVSFSLNSEKQDCDRPVELWNVVLENLKLSYEKILLISQHFQASY